MGMVVGTTGTALGFLMAFIQVKVKAPFKRFMHIVALAPIVSPPFAVATATIVLFGRGGLITRDIFRLHYDIYGLDGLTLVLTLSYFTVAYLNLKGMMQALDPALEEAAVNMGASKWRIFRTVAFERKTARRTSAGSERIKTTSAVSTATSVPAPIAIPMSAWARAGASFTPSPTIATNLPSCCSART